MNFRAKTKGCVTIFEFFATLKLLIANIQDWNHATFDKLWVRTEGVRVISLGGLIMPRFPYNF